MAIDVNNLVLYSSPYTVEQIDASVAAGFEAREIAEQLRTDAENGVFDGAPGAAGKDFTVLGYYPSLAALTAAVPSPSVGAAYGVGTEAPYDIYVWDAVNGQWVNNGPIQGAKGDKGDKGDPGAQGPQGEKGEDGAAGTVVSVSLPAAAWTGAETRWSQNLVIVGYSVTARTRLDVNASPDLIAAAMASGFGLVIGNDEGAVTAYLVGTPPEADLIVQLTATETEAAV